VVEPIDLTITTADLQAALSVEEAAGLDRGVLDGSEVWYEFLTQKDDRVRPTHRALHGSIWRVGDPDAPVPPIDYGCRCFMRYVAKPGTRAAKILPVASTNPTTKEAVWKRYLQAEVKGWQPAMKAMVDADPETQLEAAVKVLVRSNPGMTLSEARLNAKMILGILRDGSREA